MAALTVLSPRQTFEDNMRPAHLLLRVFRLLDSNDQILSQGDMVTALRGVVQASAAEDLMLIYNEVFLGLVRERAQIPRSTLLQASLCHLLRQAVVASCTALETYLPALLRANLPIVIQARGRNFVPPNDETIADYLADLKFTADDVLRLVGDEQAAAEFISTRILGLSTFSYLGSRKGVHVVGALLGLDKPWDEIAAHLSRDKKELMSVLDSTVSRRNDIVHRADRSQSDPGDEAQVIAFAWTQQAVDAIHVVCLALDEVVAEHVAPMQVMIGT